MADAGCRLVQKGARSERERCQEPEMRALREGVGVLPTVRGGRDKRGQAHHRFMINNRSCTAGSVLVCGGGRAASRPCEGSQPSVPGAGLLVGRELIGSDSRP